MDFGGFLRSSKSTSHVLSVPTIAPRQIVETGYYVALFEFAQGSCPKIVWDNDSKSVSNRDAFLLYVVNTPTDLGICKYKPKPTIIKSEFSGLFYIAVYVIIPDCEARGFSRQVVLVIAHPLPKMINFVFQHSLSEFLGFAVKLQNNASEIFPIEISRYALNLKLTIEKYPESEELLQSKANELSYMLKEIDITDADPKYRGEDKKPEYFTRINNELRSIKKLTNLKDEKEKILAFVDKLPTDPIQCNAQLRTPTHLSSIVDAMHTKETGKFLLLIKSKLIYDCLYTLFSGHSLYIVGSDQADACGVAYRIAAMCPFDKKFPVVDIAEKPLGSTSTDIVLCMNFDQERDPTGSCLDLDADTYKGTKCPTDSILVKELPKNIDHSLPVLVMLFSNEVKKIGAKFVRKTLEMSSRAKQTRERMMMQMKSIGFSISDEPIIKNFASVISTKKEIDSSSIECFL